MKLNKSGFQSYSENIKRIDALLKNKQVTKKWADNAKAVWQKKYENGEATE